MRKIGIITINDQKNYGNRLQNYAMQCFLENLGYYVETVPQKKFEENIFLRIKKKIRRIIKKICRKIICIQKQTIVITKKQKLVTERKKVFKEFNDRYIKTCNYTIKSEYVPKRVKNQFDYFVVGSDQIWNPNYTYNKSTIYLRFAKKKKRVAIAASFGIEKLPKEQEALIKKYLNEFKYVSVREESGSKIVESITGQKCDVILDPTLLVDSCCWEELVKHSQEKLPESYILTYFLGDILEQNKEFIMKFAKKNNFQIINMNNENEEHVFSWSPETFVKAIKNCQYFFTDSFHGCVFSIIFKKQFLVFKRIGTDTNIFGRIETLLGSVGLESQIFDKTTEVPRIVSDEKYKIVEKIIIQKREENKSKIKQILE